MSKRIQLVEQASYPFLLHVDNKCSTVEVANAKEVYILVSTQLLGRLRRMCALRRGWNQSLDMVGEQ